MKRLQREFLAPLNAAVAVAVAAIVVLTSPDSPVDDDDTLRLKIDLVSGPVVRKVKMVPLKSGKKRFILKQLIFSAFFFRFSKKPTNGKRKRKGL